MSRGTRWLPVRQVTYCVSFAPPVFLCITDYLCGERLDPTLKAVDEEKAGEEEGEWIPPFPFPRLILFQPRRGDCVSRGWVRLHAAHLGVLLPDALQCPSVDEPRRRGVVVVGQRTQQRVLFLRKVQLHLQAHLVQLRVNALLGSGNT